jgi:hypothetical protein
MRALEERSRLADCVGRLVGLAFVGVAGAVAVQMAWAQGTDPVRQWTMVAIVLAGLGLLALGPGLTLARGRVLAALLLLPVWLAVVSYNAASALEYFDRYLADHAARERLAGDLFRAERDELVRLRRARDAARTDRALAVIEAELARPGLGRDVRARLQAEAVDAATRDETEQRIREVAARLSGATARASGESVAQLAPLHGWITARTGVTVASNADLRALLLLIVTELGAALVPLGMAIASGRRRRLLVWRRASGAPAPEPAAGDPTTPVGLLPSEVALVGQWREARTRAAPGEMVAASVLYADYARWCRARGAVPLVAARFGAVLTGLGCAKRKATRAWTVHYTGMVLVPSGVGQRIAPVLRVAAGGT